MTQSGNHYSRCAAAYAAHRPSYPTALVAYLTDLCPDHDLAWDVGTGNGQAAVLLGEHFEHVVATDVSAEQIGQARTHARVTYRVATAHASGLATGSADLVTVAQALHWFDLPLFYAEVRRVSKPEGVFAAWSYGCVQVDASVDPVLDAFYRQRVGRYWPRERRHVETGYRDLPFPFDEIPQQGWAITSRLTRQEVLDYIGTWSAVQYARREEGSDPVVELEERLRSVWPDDGVRRTVTWPMALRVGRVAAH